MAEAEYAGLGGFFSRAGSALLERGQQREQEQTRKHEQWIACIMQGIPGETCSRILGYDPGERGRAGAEDIQAQQRAKETEEQHQERLKFGRETAEKYTPIPVEEASALDIPVDWKQALITPEKTTTAVKMTPAQISEARWQRGAPERAEKARRLEYQLKREFELWKEKQGIGDKVSEFDKTVEFIKKKLLSLSMTGEEAKIQAGKYAEEFGIETPDQREMLRLFETLWPDETAEVMNQMGGGAGTTSTKTFYGATSYQDVETAVADVPEPKKSQILEEAKRFFGVK